MNYYEINMIDMNEKSSVLCSDIRYAPAKANHLLKTTLINKIVGKIDLHPEHHSITQKGVISYIYPDAINMQKEYLLMITLHNISMSDHIIQT